MSVLPCASGSAPRQGSGVTPRWYSPRLIPLIRYCESGSPIRRRPRTVSSQAGADHGGNDTTNRKFKSPCDRCEKISQLSTAWSWILTRQAEAHLSTARSMSSSRALLELSQIPPHGRSAGTRVCRGLHLFGTEGFSRGDSVRLPPFRRKAQAMKFWRNNRIDGTFEAGADRTSRHAVPRIDVVDR